jgi:hypothetical protein
MAKHQKLVFVCQCFCFLFCFFFFSQDKYINKKKMPTQFNCHSPSNCFYCLSPVHMIFISSAQITLGLVWCSEAFPNPNSTPISYNGAHKSLKRYAFSSLGFLDGSEEWKPLLFLFRMGKRKIDRKISFPLLFDVHSQALNFVCLWV